MNHVYELWPDFEHHTSFLEQFDDVDNMFFRKYLDWKKVDIETYQPVILHNYRTQEGIKNFKMDITPSERGLIVLSERAVECLSDILEKTGQILPIATNSKRKKFYGFSPNKNVYDLSVINLEKSEWKQSVNGKLFHKVVFNSKYPKDDYIFTVYGGPLDIFVTDKFKELVEKNNLGGLSFDRIVEVSD